MTTFCQEVKPCPALQPYADCYWLHWATVGLVYAFVSREDTPKRKQKSAAVHPSVADQSLLKWGEYLVITMGCGNCHSPKKMTPQGPAPDTDRLLLGYNSNRPLGDYDKNVVKSGQWVMFNG